MQRSLLDQRREIEQESAQRSVEQRNLRQQQRAQLESNRLQSAPSYLTAQEREPIQNGGSSYPFSTANGQAWQRLPNVHRPPMVRAAPAPRERQGYPSRPIAIPRNSYNSAAPAYPAPSTAPHYIPQNPTNQSTQVSRTLAAPETGTQVSRSLSFTYTTIRGALDGNKPSSLSDSPSWRCLNCSCINSVSRESLLCKQCNRQRSGVRRRDSAR